jgi:hypothetical protein
LEREEGDPGRERDSREQSRGAPDLGARDLARVGADRDADGDRDEREREGKSAERERPRSYQRSALGSIGLSLVSRPVT